MIKTGKMLNLLELVVWSGHVAGEQPVSALVTAPPEAGKTEIIMKFAGNKGCVALTDVTAYGIMRDYGQLIINKEVRHIIIPDMVKPMSRGKDTVHTLIAFLNSLIEEGVLRVSTYAEKIGAPSPGINTQAQPIPVQCGLIATLAKDILEDGRHHWSRMGFMSRLLPISYDYGITTKMEIQQSIARRDYQGDTPINLNLPKIDVAVKLDLPQGNELMALTNTLISVGKNSAGRVYGFRLQKHLQRLAMASAIKDGRDIVLQKDVDLVKDLSSVINLEYYPI